MIRICRVLSVCLLALISAALLHAANLFPTAALYPAGSDPNLQAVGDFNGDGIADVLIVNAAPGMIAHLSVLPGTGGGAFGPAIVSPNLGYAVTYLQVGDVNGDGILDVAASYSNRRSTYVGINLGNGNGTFTQSAVIPVSGSLAFWIVIADFNGDGYPDIGIVTSYVQINVLLNDGTGNFLAAITTNCRAELFRVVTGDFNHDGRIDIAGIDVGQMSMWTVSGNGDGTFQAPVKIATNTRFFSIASADFNGDGNDDLAVNDWQNQAEIWNGNGDGTFQQPRLYPALYGDLRIADFNGDGKPDLLADASGWIEDVLINKGENAGFAAPIGLNAGIAPLLGESADLAADLNGDGLADLVLSAPVEQSIGVLLNRGKKLFNAAQAYGTYRDALNALAVADFNNDGKPDIAVSDDKGILVALSRSNGIYQKPATTNATGNVFAIAAADFNGDHNIDLVYSTSGSLGILLGRGNGAFGAQKTISGFGYASDVMVSDFNGDQKQDVAVTVTGGIAILLGRGNGSFQPAVVYSVPNGALSITVGDLNQDGKLDLATNGAATVSELMGNGDGTFQPAVLIASNVLVRIDAIANADINHDGHSDLLMVGLGGPPSLIYFFGIGDGTFGSKQEIPLNTDAAGIALATGDVNKDGFTDVVVGITGSGGSYEPATLLLGNSFGTFDEQFLFYTAGVNYRGIALADANQDGWPDLFLTDVLYTQVVVVPNNAGAGARFF